MNLEQTPPVAVGAGLRADRGDGSTQKSQTSTPKDGEQEIVSGAISQPDIITLGRHDEQSFTEPLRILGWAAEDHVVQEPSSLPRGRS